MEYHDFEVERQGALLRVTLNGRQNTLSVRLLTGLEGLARDIGQDPAIRAVILTGASGMFSAGLDLKDPEIHLVSRGTAAQRRRLALLGQRLCQAWEDLEAVTVAAIEGPCVGGGVSLVLACDFRIMGRAAFMLVPEIDLGLNYSWGSIPRLLHLIGPARTKLMILTARRVSAENCLAWGLTEEVVPDGSSLEAAAALAQSILDKPQLPAAMTKQAVNRLATALDRTASFMDADQFVLTTYSEEHLQKQKELLAAFAGKNAGES